MTTVTFHPSRLKGSAAVPPAKSEAHRALLLAALGSTPCRLTGFAPPLCDDTLAMMAGAEALGARVLYRDGALEVFPAPEPVPGAAMAQCHVRACAAALRMLIPAFLVRGQAVRFTMEEGLFRRPLQAFAPLMERLGATMERTPAQNGQPCCVTVQGRMPAGEYQIDGSHSSQFASGLLMALAHARNGQGQPAPSTLRITGEIVSRPYLDMTLRLMERFHMDHTEGEPGVFQLPPRRKPSPESVAVSGDWSQAAVLLCANAMGSGVRVRNLPVVREECLQGDARITAFLEQMGMRMLCPGGELYAACPSRAWLRPLRVDCADVPDIAPILALTCTQARGVSRLTGVGRLAIKECDRLRGTAELLNRLGARAEVSPDGDALTISGPCKLKGGFEADALGDHRMVMLLAVAALIADGPVTVRGADALNKSWPGFLETYQQLGGELS